MPKYSIYNDYGQIINKIDIPLCDKNLMLSNVNWVAGEAPDNSYIENGKIVLMPSKPNENYIFDYKTKKWVFDYEKVIYINKNKRNSLLVSSDWTQLPDVDLTQIEKTRWAAYRQALRDMTEQDFIDGNFPIY